MQSRLLSMVLQGMHRVYPYVSECVSVLLLLEKHVNVLFRVVHQSPIRTALQALMLLMLLAHIDKQQQQQQQKQQHQQKQHKHQKQQQQKQQQHYQQQQQQQCDDDDDGDDVRVSKKAKKIHTKITHKHNNNNSNKTRTANAESESETTTTTTMSSLVDRFYRALYALLLSPTLSQIPQPQLLFHILFQSIKNDAEPLRVIAFVKRLLQVSVCHCSAAFVAAAAIVVAETVQFQPQLKQVLSQMSENTTTSTTTTESAAMTTATTTAKSATATATAATTTATTAAMYDPRKREPKFAIAQTPQQQQPLWEALLLSHHYHPSVQSLIRSLIRSYLTALFVLGFNLCSEAVRA